MLITCSLVSNFVFGFCERIPGYSFRKLRENPKPTHTLKHTCSTLLCRQKHKHIDEVSETERQLTFCCEYCESCETTYGNGSFIHSFRRSHSFIYLNSSVLCCGSEEGKSGQKGEKIFCMNSPQISVFLLLE